MSPLEYDGEPHEIDVYLDDVIDTVEPIPQRSPVMEDALPDVPTEEPIDPEATADGYIGLARTIPDDEPETVVTTDTPVITDDAVSTPPVTLPTQVLTADDLFEHMKQRHQTRIDKHLSNRE